MMKGTEFLIDTEEFDKRCLDSSRAAMDLYKKECGEEADTIELQEKLEKVYVVFWNQFVQSLAVNVGVVSPSSP